MKRNNYFKKQTNKQKWYNSTNYCNENYIQQTNV